jgi:hypothetical protein
MLCVNEYITLLFNENNTSNVTCMGMKKRLDCGEDDQKSVLVSAGHFVVGVVTEFIEKPP